MPVNYPVEKIIDEEGNVLALVDVSARALLGDDELQTNAKTCTGGINELKQSLDVKVDGKLVTIDDTTDQYGVIKIDNTWGTGTVDDFYILSNMSDNSSYPYKLTISTVSTAKIGIRFRNQSTNAGITNTAINTKALILKVN